MRDRMQGAGNMNWVEVGELTALAESDCFSYYHDKKQIIHDGCCLFRGRKAEVGIGVLASHLGYLGLAL